MLTDDQRRILERLHRCGVWYIGETQRGGFIHVLPEHANTRGVRRLIAQNRTIVQQAFWPASGALIAQLLNPPPVVHYDVTELVTDAEGGRDAAAATTDARP